MIIIIAWCYKLLINGTASEAEGSARQFPAMAVFRCLLLARDGQQGHVIDLVLAAL